METSIERTAERTRETILTDVRQLVAEQAGRPIEEIGSEDDLFTDLGFDSLDVVELSMEIEEHFDIRLPDEVAETSTKVGAIADGVSQLLEA